MFASHIAMMRPAAFGFNIETAANNEFQHNNPTNTKTLQHEANEAFNRLKNVVSNAGVIVHELTDTLHPPKPDAVFLNNWFACESNQLVLFPMEAISRRSEARPEIISKLQEITGCNTVVDLRNHVQSNMFLEGTGSIVPDRTHRIAYACKSSRTNEQLFTSFCAKYNYRPVHFTAVGKNGHPVYHTNVMMCIGQTFAIICSHSITDETERKFVLNTLEETAHKIIDISPEQMYNFCGNMLALESQSGEPVLVMSTKAYKSLTSGQADALSLCTNLVHANIEIIEQTGGGGVRCMMAELFINH